MRPDRAWVLLGSGRRLNLVDPQPDDWAFAELDSLELLRRF